MAKKHKIGDFLIRIKRPIELIPDRDYKLVTIKMNHKGVVLRGKKKGALIKSKMYEVQKGDFILSGIDARNGAFGIVPEELDGAIVTNDFWYFKIDENVISKRLFLELTATTWFDEICKKGSDGTTQRIRLQKDKFFTQEIYLPEGFEQRNLLGKLLNFKENQGKLTSEIQTQKSLLTQLKQAILQEAIQGKLTRDWRAENPELISGENSAATLLENIKAEKARLVKENKIKKEKPLPPITEEEILFELPKGWVWTRFQDISINRDDLRKPISKKERELREKIYDYYGASGVIDKIDGYTHEGSFLLIGEDGSNLRLRSTPIAFEVSGKFWVNNHAHSVEFLNGTTQNYICQFLNGTDISPYISGGFQPKLSQTNLNKIPTPFPPIGEQKAIVKKVETLMEKCAALEQEIIQSEQHAQMLMQAVLKEAFEEEEKEKHQEEIISSIS